ncbi:MAG: type II toxin-antitoxin system HicA family toxin, partial [Prochloron sp. SP5CPC1]|nr:type II toxin-antitoxin system HicA family toxin [Candidatus Paraprochloron terpiosi SP5CPC1]
GEYLAKALEKLGYVVERQTGSHIRLTTQYKGEHHVTIPNHSPILRDIENYLGLTREQLLKPLFS